MGAYNEEKNIAKCIKSIIAQTYINWEFIICNDCSKDKTKDILESFCLEDKRIIVLNNEKNMRLAASLNRCLEAAKGKYIARMDADDESLPERLEKQVQYLEEHHDIDCVGTARIIFDETGDIGVRIGNEHPKKDDLLFTTPFAHPTIMMKASVYKALGGYTVSRKTMRAEDLDLWFRFYGKGYKGYNIQTPLYRYKEGVEDFSKRSLKAGIETSKVFWDGYKIIGVKWYKRVLAVKPIIAALIPNRLMHTYHKKNTEKTQTYHL